MFPWRNRRSAQGPDFSLGRAGTDLDGQGATRPISFPEEDIVEEQDIASASIEAPIPDMSPARREAMTAMARRHPATIALIEEITAQVSAESRRRIELAQATIRQGFVENLGPFAGVGIGALGAFATANLLLVTIALALGQVMAPWLAMLLVSGLTLAVVSVIAVRTSLRRGWSIPSVNRLTARRFVERLSAIR
jgi:hypothetical protein